MRAMGVVLLVAIATAGCGTGRVGADGKPMPRYTAAKVILGVVAVGAAAIAAGAAVKGQRLEDDLRDDSRTGGLTGRQFADRDNEGKRWNRAARASAFASGLALIGMGVIWEMSLGDGAARGKDESRPDAKPIFPVQPSGSPAGGPARSPAAAPPAAK